MKGIIFDVDGTLWDSTEQVAVAWNHIIHEQVDPHRSLTAEDLKREFGKPIEQIVDGFFPELSEEEREGLRRKLFDHENEWLKTAVCKVYDKMPETVKVLSARYPLFIVSNCQAGYIEVFLENTKLGQYFKDFACPGDTGKLKADNIRIVMERNGLQEAVYVGDTQGDANACKEAGVPMIYAAYGFGEVEEAHPVIKRFEDLLTAVE